MKTIGEVSQDTLLLQNFLSDQPPGTVLSYHDIQSQTGVTMNLAGKSHLRQAMKHLRCEYSCVRGYGVRLADADGVMPILSSRIRRIDKAVIRADRSQKNLQDQFFHSLNQQDQKKILFAGAVFGAIRLAAEQGKQIQRKDQMLPTIIIPLPNISG